MGKANSRVAVTPDTLKVEAQYRRTDNIAVALPHPSSCAPFLKSASIVCTRTAHVTPSTPLLVPAGPVRQVQVRPLQSSTTRRRPDHHHPRPRNPKLNPPHFLLPTSTPPPTTASQPQPADHRLEVNSQQLPATTAPRHSSSVATRCWAFEGAWSRPSRFRLRSPISVYLPLPPSLLPPTPNSSLAEDTHETKPQHPPPSAAARLCPFRIAEPSSPRLPSIQHPCSHDRREHFLPLLRKAYRQESPTPHIRHRQVC